MGPARGRVTRCGLWVLFLLDFALAVLAFPGFVVTSGVAAMLLGLGGDGAWEYVANSLYMAGCLTVLAGATVSLGHVLKVGEMQSRIGHRTQRFLRRATWALFWASLLMGMVALVAFGAEAARAVRAVAGSRLVVWESLGKVVRTAAFPVLLASASVCIHHVLVSLGNRSGQIRPVARPSAWFLLGANTAIAGALSFRLARTIFTTSRGLDGLAAWGAGETIETILRACAILAVVSLIVGLGHVTTRSGTHVAFHLAA